MKKIIIIGLINLILPAPITIADLNQQNQQQIYRIDKTKDPIPDLPHNSATIMNYGVSPEITHDQYRDFRLNITMEGWFYSYFSEYMKGIGGKDRFIKRFTSYEGPYFRSADWNKEIAELKANFTITAHARHFKNDDYFYTLFVNWLKSPRGWENFYNVYQGINLKNNTYKMPVGYNQAEAVESFRMEGAILQFEFYPLSSKGDAWAVNNICRIFPFEHEIIPLTYYYQDDKYVNHTYEKTAPVMPIGIPSPKLHTPVGALLEKINEYIAYNFNLPEWADQLVEIPKLEWSQYISLSEDKPTSIGIIFNNLQSQPYIVKFIKIYLIKLIEMI